MKRQFLNTSLLFSLALASTVNALDNHTINRDGIEEFSLERTIPARYDAETVTAAGCIALPDSWSEPSAVSVEGSQQIDATTSAFTATATRYADGETEIASIQALEGYVWYCYQDIVRDYAIDNNANLSFAIATDDVNTLIYTSIGFLEGVDDGPGGTNYFHYQAMLSHQVIRDTEAGDYFLNFSAEFLASEFIAEDFNPSDTDYEIIKVEDITYFLGYDGQSFSLDSDGVFKSYVTPDNARRYYINGQFVFLITEGRFDNADIAIQFGSDLNNLSEVYDINNVGVSASVLSYDARTGNYVLLNRTNSGGQTIGYYTSADLITWTLNTVGPYQNDDVAFASDGRALMKNTSRANPLMFRTSDGDWEEFTLYSSEESFSARGILFQDDRFYALLKEYDIDNTSNLLSLQLGYSDDLTSWNWVTLTNTADDISTLPTLVGLGTNQVAVLNGANFFLSSDKGITWSTAISPMNVIGLNDSVDTSVLNIDMDTLINVDNILVGTARISTNSHTLSDFIFTTPDMVNFEPVHNSKNALTFGINNVLYFYESGDNDWGIHKKTAASIAVVEPETEPEVVEPETESTSSRSSGGSLFWLVLVFATLGITKRTSARTDTA